MDIASLGGLIVGIVMMVFGIGIASLGNFVDFASVLITIMGSLSGVIVSRSIADSINGFKSFGLVFKTVATDPTDTIKNIIRLSNVARKEGLLALEEAAGELEDAFLKKASCLL